MNRHQAIRAEPDIEAFKAAALRCPLPSAVELIGEKWAFLILRGALNGLEHFEQFQAGLGIARNILSNRLAKLVDGGILERNSDSADRRKVIYSLSPKGEALLPVVLALRQWGQLATVILRPIVHKWGRERSKIESTSGHQGRTGH